MSEYEEYSGGGAKYPQIKLEALGDKLEGVIEDTWVATSNYGDNERYRNFSVTQENGETVTFYGSSRGMPRDIVDADIIAGDEIRITVDVIKPTKFRNMPVYKVSLKRRARTAASTDPRDEDF